MSSALAEYVAAHGPSITVGQRTLEVTRIADDGDFAMATVKAKKAIYTAIRCNNARVIGAPGAEVWSILSNGKKCREVGEFAVHEGEVKTLC